LRLAAGGRCQRQFPKQSLGNLFRTTDAIEQAHVFKIVGGKSSTETLSKISRQTCHKRFSVFGTWFTPLLKFHDPPADFPVCCRHERVDCARAGMACGVQQFGDAPDQPRIVGGGFGSLLFDNGFRHAPGNRLTSPGRRFNSYPE
jgi:hypothetical protein